MLAAALNQIVQFLKLAEYTLLELIANKAGLSAQELPITYLGLFKEFINVNFQHKL
jgi:hypothetical protein